MQPPPLPQYPVDFSSGGKFTCDERVQRHIMPPEKGDQISEEDICSKEKDFLRLDFKNKRQLVCFDEKELSSIV